MRRLKLAGLQKILAITLSLSVLGTRGLARTRQSFEIEGGRGTSKVSYKDSEGLSGDGIESKTVDGKIETAGISFLFYTKETYGLIPAEKTADGGKSGGPFGIVMAIVAVARAAVALPPSILLLPGIFLPATVKVGLTGRSTSMERDSEIFYGSKARFRSVAANFRFSAYPLATEFLSLGYFLGIEQGFVQMKYEDPQVDTEKERAGTVLTIGYTGGIELTRSIAGTGPVLKAVYAEEQPLWNISGSSSSSPSVMKHLTVDLGWRTGF